MNELQRSERNELAPNGQPVRLTKAEAILILTPMFSLFPQAKMSETAIKQYIRLLQDIPPAALQQAVDAALGESEWLPTVALIRRCYTELKDKSRPALVEDDGATLHGVQWVLPHEERELREKGWRDDEGA